MCALGVLLENFSKELGEYIFNGFLNQKRDTENL